MFNFGSCHRQKSLNFDNRHRQKTLNFLKAVEIIYMLCYNYNNNIEVKVWKTQYLV